MAKSKKPLAAVDLVPAQAETDLGFVQQVGAGVIAFLKNAAAFLRRADQFEKRAIELRDQARKWTVPTNSSQDVALQGQLQSIAKGKQTIEVHWDGTAAAPGITRLFYQLHRRSTQKRDAGIKALDEAATIGNRLHNTFTDNEKRRAEEETRRLQAIEDARAKKQRDAELAELEKQALKAEEASEDLSARERDFVERMASPGVVVLPEVAAEFAGYKDFEKQAERLMASKKILKAIEAQKSAHALRRQASAVAAAPLETREVEVKPDIERAAGAKDVTRWKAEVFDRDKFIAAVFNGDIPRDALTIDEKRVNEYAREKKQNLDRWPGVRAVKDTKVQ